MRKRKKYEVYDTGFPFSEIIALNINDCLEEIEKRKASLVIIDGKMGEGKTTLAYQLGQHIERYYKKKKGESFYDPLYFNLKNQIGMGGVKFKEKLEICRNEQLKVVIYDEAGDFSKRSALSNFNHELNRIFQTFRTYKVLIIICLPYFNILDNNLFDEGVPKLLLNLHGRNEKEGRIRGYGYDEMLWLRYYMSQEKVKKQKCYKRVTPNFRGKFVDLPSDLSIELDKYSTEGKAEILNKSILSDSDLLPYKEIAKKVKMSIPWVKNKVSILKIKEIKKYKRSKYFDSSIIECLNDLK